MESYNKFTKTIVKIRGGTKWVNNYLLRVLYDLFKLYNNIEVVLELSEYIVLPL